MKKKRKLKKKVIRSFIILGIIVFFIIIGIILGIQHYKKIHSYPYKLQKIGYQQTEIEEIIKLEDKQIEDILKKEYDKRLIKFLKQKYFIYDNLNRYENYFKEHRDLEYSKIISLVNVNADYEFYTHTKKADINQGYSMLVNKYHLLDKNYMPDDLVDVSNQHCYGKQKLKKEVYQNFISMFNAAKEEELTIIINSSYRTYDYQKTLWNQYANKNGEEWANKYAAQAGSSEHQTGMAIDVTTYGAKDFEDTHAFKWMQQNAYKYGFILRYPEDKIDITGYAYESWHYRYVGKDLAKKVYESNLTFDEYYEYYLK